MKLHANARTCFHCRSLIVSRVVEAHQSSNSVAADFRVSPRTVHKWAKRFRSGGFEALKDRSSRPKQIPRQLLKPGPGLHDAVFSMLHTPPADCGYNRTTWRLSDLRTALAAKGTIATSASISAVIKAAGYRWKAARVTLTGKDPNYREKVEAIHSALSQLQEDEAIFSIDEFGPFAIKMRGGRSLQGPKEIRMVPQWQVSKGSLIVSAALELRTNQIIHLYSQRKNSAETIKLIQLIRKTYKGYRQIYLSWDAAPWHDSRELLEEVDFLNGWARYDHAPDIEFKPLPAGAQFLNVIEFVFSGMARSIIHNSNYDDVEQAKAAIDRYFDERNSNFQKHPRRAGKAIWGNERSLAAFRDANNCKDPKYR